MKEREDRGLGDLDELMDMLDGNVGRASARLTALFHDLEAMIKQEIAALTGDGPGSRFAKLKAAAEKMKKELKAELKALQKQLEAMAAELTEKRKRVTNLEQMADTLRASNAAANEQLQAAVRERQAAESLAKEQDREIARLKADIADMLKAPRPRAEAATSFAPGQDPTSLQAKIAALQEQLDAVTRERDSLKSELQELRTSHTVLKAQLDDKVAELSKLKWDMTGAADSSEALTAEKARSAALQEQLDSSHAAYQASCDRIAVLEAQLRGEAGHMAADAAREAHEKHHHILSETTARAEEEEQQQEEEEKEQEEHEEEDDEEEFEELRYVWL